MNIKTTAILVLMAVFGTGIVYKYISLNGVINDKENNILALEATLMATKLRLNTEQINSKSLESKLVALNDEIIAKAKLNKELSLKYEEWSNKPPEIKYVNKVVKEIVVETKYVDGVCEDGLDLNKKISGLKYEDL